MAVNRVLHGFGSGDLGGVSSPFSRRVHWPRSRSTSYPSTISTQCLPMMLARRSGSSTQEIRLSSVQTSFPPSIYTPPSSPLRETVGPISSGVCMENMSLVQGKQSHVTMCCPRVVLKVIVVIEPQFNWSAKVHSNPEPWYIWIEDGLYSHPGASVLHSMAALSHVGNSLKLDSCLSSRL